MLKSLTILSHKVTLWVTNSIPLMYSICMLNTTTLLQDIIFHGQCEASCQSSSNLTIEPINASSYSYMYQLRRPTIYHRFKSVIIKQMRLPIICQYHVKSQIIEPKSTCIFKLWSSEAMIDLQSTMLNEQVKMHIIVWRARSHEVCG